MRTSQIPVILGGYDSQRQSFINVVKAAAGKAPVACWFPHRNDTTTSVDPISGRVWTAEATMAGQISPLGKGSQRSFNGSSNYLSTPDASNLSFVEPLTFSIFAVANVTDTANTRNILNKASATQAEWALRIGTTDLLFLLRSSLDATNQSTMLSNSAITQGSLHSFGSTYDGSGGATGAGSILYQDGAAIAQTGSAVGSYTTMADGTEPVMVGAATSGAPSAFFQGTMGLVLLIPINASAAIMLGLHNATRQYFQF